MVKDKNEESRVLTEAEEKRLQNYEKVSNEYVEQGYQKKELTVGLVAANIFAILYGIPLAAAGVILFYKVHPEREMFGNLFPDVVIFFVLYVVLVVVHELVHGVTWSLFAERHWKDIEFGYIKEYSTPYCACLCPLAKGSYIIGALMPLIVLGIIPMAAAIIAGSGLWLAIGIMMIISAGGDILIVVNILRHKSDCKEIVYMDHPTQAGGVVFER